MDIQLLLQYIVDNEQDWIKRHHNTAPIKIQLAIKHYSFLIFTYVVFSSEEVCHGKYMYQTLCTIWLCLVVNAARCHKIFDVKI